ncbi:DUF4231 domain-containing protein [Cloacibacterium sp.]|uniref:DUF4231 domain-containing protein n=1 Tax=Cloacibacterium sp. TaxID=1913682 RepID=UPI0039E3723D
MEEKFYPLLFKIADDKSKKSQNIFIRLNMFILLLLILSSVSSIYTTVPKNITTFSTICLILSTLFNIYILFFRPEKSWYEGRAIAESVKTLTWKFITNTKPFKISLKQEKAEQIFNENLKKIIGQRRDFYILIGQNYPDENMISDEMISIRNSSFEERKKKYVEDRIQDQINWYLTKTKQNTLNKNIALSLIIGFQILAIFFFIYEENLFINFSFTSILITMTSVFMTWLQLKRFQELTDAYGITATELKLIKEKSKFILDNTQLEKYVDDTENAISREHTLWLARRDNIELYK